VPTRALNAHQRAQSATRTIANVRQGQLGARSHAFACVERAPTCAKTWGCACRKLRHAQPQVFPLACDRPRSNARERVRMRSLVMSVPCLTCLPIWFCYTCVSIRPSLRPDRTGLHFIHVCHFIYAVSRIPPGQVVRLRCWGGVKNFIIIGI
jgi:hypothetical protein